MSYFETITVGNLYKDALKNATKTLDIAHSEIHSGDSFKAYSRQAALGTGTVKYAIEVGADPMHFVLDIGAYNGSLRVELYEGATFTSGTPLTIQNRNRISTDASVATITSGVTTTDGALLDEMFVGAAGKSGDNARSESEWILAPNTTYRVDLIGLVAGTQAIVGFDWYI
jgi:hypothetical protein